MAGRVKGVSVIVCCYNSSLRLPKTLSFLASQSVDLDTQWEIIIVNNNSNDDTGLVARQLWEALHSPTLLSIVDEPIAGLSYAREKGISEAQYDLYLFCDDDNWLRADYIKNTIAIFNKNPEIGVLGGWSTAAFEAEKPEWFDKFKGNFAVGTPVNEPGVILDAQGFLYGAGMVIHESTFRLLKERGFKSILKDRKGKLLSSGGDVELVYAIKLLGIPVMFSELLFFNHYMPKERMQWDYLLRLRASMYWSNFVLNIYIDALNDKPLSSKWLIKKILKSFLYIYRQNKRLQKLSYRKQLMLENQIAIRRLFIKHIRFYYQTRLNLKKLIND
ncbi:glycosyltransferase [Psychroserpens sp. Hel_I_66]|uniref:glycosyltransferase n=1 Tax=Psychroserpens sp. Hel_I_66 TaxID=1250004 RepID=UPI00068BE191|nr:glycosyltransferase [Psychroserpens sp. Hel_I_66]